MIKFKFIHSSYSDLRRLLEDCKNFSTKVENPIGVLNLPVGDYMIRGNKKGQRKEYFHFGNEVWYLISNVEENRVENKNKKSNRTLIIYPFVLMKNYSSKFLLLFSVTVPSRIC